MGADCHPSALPSLYCADTARPSFLSLELRSEPAHSGLLRAGWQPSPGSQVPSRSCLQQLLPAGTGRRLCKKGSGVTEGMVSVHGCRTTQVAPHHCMGQRPKATFYVPSHFKAKPPEISDWSPMFQVYHK